MARLAELEARLASIGALDDVIGAMRAIAAVRMRQASDALRSARVRADTVRAALEATRRLLPEQPQPPVTTASLVVVFCTEHGFAGAFNERLLGGTGDGPLIIVGSRGALLASERRLDVIATLAAASHPSGVLDVARCTATTVYEQLPRMDLERVDVVFGRCTTALGVVIERIHLLPVAPPLELSTMSPPLHHLDPRALLEQLTGELVLSELARIAMESLAAESSARMQALSTVRDNIERKLGELRLAKHRARQDQVTMELLDLVTGTEALT